ncbi:hypothetical protein GE061_008461 [Apolygus lucorum]|uniref:Uncharacterized protein n=1 Tax=Apolygus lucorum TaxID=248454 RepID=A0A8S9WRA1_APOLU|nr:hypothetical protein GE061_008461 [Apolygus lucorum]
MGDSFQRSNDDGIETNDVLGVVKTTSTSYVAVLEQRYQALAEEIKIKQQKRDEQKKVGDSLKKVLEDLISRKKQQLEEHSEERKKCEEKMGVLENEILNVQIYTSNLNEHNDLMKWFIQIWKNKFTEIKKKLSK